MRTFRVIVAGAEYEVAIEEIFDTSDATQQASPQPAIPRTNAQPVAKSHPAPTPASPKAPAGEGTIVAAMPGTITDVKVSKGDNVKRGDTLLILEAMKMENEIKAPCDGTVSAIEVSKGAAVNAGMALMVLT